MAADLSHRPRVFEPYFPPITQDPQFMAFVRQCVDDVREFSRAGAFEEQYLAQAQNDSELETRTFQLHYARYEMPRCIW